MANTKGRKTVNASSEYFSVRAAITSELLRHSDLDPSADSRVGPLQPGKKN